MRYKANIAPPSSPSLVWKMILLYSLQYSYLSGTTTVLTTVHTIDVEEILAFAGC